MNNLIETEFMHFALLGQYFKQDVVVANKFFPGVEPSSPDDVEIIV